MIRESFGSISNNYQYMTPDDIYKAVEGAVEKTLPPTVERVVNGKIAKVQEILEKHIEDEEKHKEIFLKHIDEMEPFKKFINTLDNLHAFFKWGGVGFFAVIAFIYLLFRKL